MALRHSLGIGVVCLTMLNCGCGTGTGSQPSLRSVYADVYPDHVVPCLDAMQELPFADGENLRAVTDSNSVCVISIWFDSQRDIDAFRESRSAMGKSPDSVLHRMSDGDSRRIPLELSVGERPLPH